MLFSIDSNPARRSKPRTILWSGCGNAGKYENYLCSREVLLRWAETQGAKQQGEIFAPTWVSAMEEAIGTVEGAAQTLGRGSPWGTDTKVTDDFLAPLFDDFFGRLNLPNLMKKTDYNTLAQLVDPEDLDPEVAEMLEQICEVWRARHPRT